LVCQAQRLEHENQSRLQQKQAAELKKTLQRQLSKSHDNSSSNLLATDGSAANGTNSGSNSPKLSLVSLLVLVRNWKTTPATMG